MKNHNTTINGLWLQQSLRSETTTVNEPITDIDATLARELPTNVPRHFVAYLDYTILIGCYVNGQWQHHPAASFKLEHVQRLRVFNQDEELLIWRSNGMFKGRLRQDYEKSCNKGCPIEIIEARQILVGTAIDSECDAPDFTKITEQRGATLTLPFTGFQVDDRKQRLSILTRNYVGYLVETQQATYVDCRFVAFVDQNGNSL